MLVVRAMLPPSRWNPGVIWAHLEGEPNSILFGPVRCRGEADNTYARAHANADEDPTHIGGDHPAGIYIISGVVRFKDDSPHFNTYGPVFIGVDPFAGEALTAKLLGRRGIGIHGGKLGAGGELRATHGCLRLDNDHIELLAMQVDTAGHGNTRYVVELKDLA
jgi:hypothetical protein